MSVDHKEADNLLLKFKKEEIAEAVFNSSVNNGFAVALWRLPGSENIELAADFSNNLVRTKADLEYSRPGFAVSPFHNPGNKYTYFIPAEVYYNSSTHSFSWLYGSKQETMEKLGNALLNPPAAVNLPSSFKESGVSKEQFTSAVSDAIEAINNYSFKKVVLARKNVIAQPNTSPVSSFLNLCKNYPEAFVSLIYLPDEGIWIGASPELLISLDKNKIFRTIALAGTQQLDPDKKISEAVWTQKEIEEQALVSRYIVSCFKAIRLREYEEDGPYTIQAGSLIHLRTDFSVDIKGVNFPELGSMMLDLLHPTSAVCGMPKEEAFRFIMEKEHLERALFSGYLGPVNIRNESRLYVNLRCAKLTDNAAITYAGAGITKDSIPEKEWKETEIKMGVIGRYL